MIAGWYFDHMSWMKILIVFCVSTLLLASFANNYIKINELSFSNNQSISNAYTLTFLRGYSPSGNPVSNSLSSWNFRNVFLFWISYYFVTTLYSVDPLFLFLKASKSTSTPFSLSFYNNRSLDITEVWHGKTTFSISSFQGIY